MRVEKSFRHTSKFVHNYNTDTWVCVNIDIRYCAEKLSARSTL